MAFSPRKMERPEISDPSPKTWIVVGGKRGGTSVLAQLLGDNVAKFEHCGNGHNEDLDFVKWNNMVLNEAGGDWNLLPPDEEIAKAVEMHKDSLVDLIKSKQNGSAWGWKDPRQGATLKHILPYLEDDVYLVCVFRKPDKVAESIHRTWPQHSVEFGKSVVLDYYHRILEAVEEFIK